MILFIRTCYYLSFIACQTNNKEKKTILPCSRIQSSSIHESIQSSSIHGSFQSSSIQGSIQSNSIQGSIYWFMRTSSMGQHQSDSRVKLNRCPRVNVKGHSTKAFLYQHQGLSLLGVHSQSSSIDQISGSLILPRLFYLYKRYLFCIV